MRDMREVIWTLGADADVQSVYERLEQWREGAGDTFYKRVLASVEILRSFPHMGSQVPGRNLRRVLVHNGNYGLFYTEQPHRLVIHAVIDLRRDPNSIWRRLDG
jgi:plasmid stabilization system protein ParE